jgi:hypothetical protein
MGEGIYRMAGLGGDRTTLAELNGAVEDLLVVGGWVYFKGSSGPVSRVPASGGAVQPLTDALPWPVALAADATHLYAAGGTEILKLPLAGGAAESLHQTDPVYPNSLVVDDGAVYWTDTYYEAVLRLSPK